MRTLKYKCTGQKLTTDSNCDFSSIVQGSKGFLQVSINFNTDWSGTVKVAEFWTADKTVYPVLLSNNTCMIPDEVTTAKRIYFRIIGKRGNTRIITNKLTIRQEG